MSDKIAWFDCFSGASGDMILGALVDAGLPIGELQADLDKLGCGPIRLRAEKVDRAGISATKLHVEYPHEDHHHRGLPEIREIIQKAELPEKVKSDAVAIFTRLAEAEAAVHGVAVEKVHFHEVGALDAIADIVGAAAALHRLGVKAIRFSTLRLGGGTVRAAHGTLPVPAPATARLVEGFACELGPVEKELLTPTGAAILTTLGSQEPMGAFRPACSGYGAGANEFTGHPNALRAMIGEAVSDDESDSVWVVEANLDDITAEVCGHAVERLLAEGALDAWASAIQMKKSRPGWLLSAIVAKEKLAHVEETLFRETTTFGLRRYPVERSKLSREFRKVSTPYGMVNVKIGSRGGKVLTVSPEYEDCRRTALEKGVPLREVIQAAIRAFNP
jgi:hypothetical protein